MKLLELLGTETDAFDSLQQRDNEEANQAPGDRAFKDREKKPETPRRSSNVSKANRIRNQVRTKKRESNPVGDDTPSQSSAGGHGSAFLFR